MKIDIVIRGEDHLSNTARQVLIYEALNVKVPQFAHLSMVMGADNTKLSKRHGAQSVSEYCNEGYLPVAILNYLSLLGWSPVNEKEFKSGVKTVLGTCSSIGILVENKEPNELILASLLTDSIIL